MKTLACTLGLPVVAAVLAAGCGSGTSPAISRNNVGTGTHTIKVVGDISASDVPGTPNYNTSFTVDVANNLGNAVSGAAVTISNPVAGNIVLTESAVGSGSYLASRAAFYDGDYGLTVIHGADTVRDVVVGGVARFAVTKPLRFDTVLVNQPLLVRWTVPSEAKSAEIETRDFPNTTIPDTGAYVIPGSAFVNPRPDDRVRVFRNNEVDIAGGLAGSILTLSVRASADPICVKSPTSTC
jgi:hypothetical protein